ncbi:flagellar protein FlaF [Roseibium denhamense]|uniref:Flagellar protein FlaF n=2 Tax=Roseibium denhamense TaxID=76305 RepID=A0ABY1N897_9HYPH|nr:flagellar protein FlaF [Roseibium denhamense]SMP03147.1 flagellar protein FlaF [Roseibium denhamense]
MKAAARLQLIKDEWDNLTLEERDEALVYNRKLWTVLVTSATSAESELPQQIKNNVGSLGVFVMKQTMDIIITADPKKLDTLISINRSIAEGLRAVPDPIEQPEAAQAG